MAQAKESVLTDAQLEQAIASKNVRVISTLLALAITEKDLFAIKLLLESGGDLNCPLQDGTTSLLCVITVNDKEVSDFVEGFCDEKTLENWDKQLDLLQAMADQRMAQQSQAPRLSEGGFVADMNKPPQQKSPSPAAKSDPPQLRRDPPAAPGKSGGCTML